VMPIESDPPCGSFSAAASCFGHPTMTVKNSVHNTFV
jgi:hypothetical protein